MGIKSRIESTRLGSRMIKEHRYRNVTFAVMSLIFNLLFAFYNGALAMLNGSLWFGAICMYYLLLITMRFSAVLGGRRNNIDMEHTISYTEVAVSVLTMQQSMLVSFGEMERSKSYVLNMLTGIAVCSFIITLGVFLLNTKISKNPLDK